MELIAKAIDIKPDFEDAHYNLANILKQLGQCDDAVVHFRKAIDIKPEFAGAHSDLAFTLLELGRQNEAVSHFQKAISIKPDFAEAHNNLGNVLKQLGQGDDAMVHFHKAIDIKPDFSEAHSNLGLVLQDTGRPDKANLHYRKAIAIEPDFAKAHSNLGNALKQTGQLDEAIVHYHKAIAINPDFDRAHNNLGNALNERRQLEEATVHFHKAIKLKPDFAAAHSNLGNALKELGRRDEAIAHYRKAITIEPEFADAHGNIGLALQEVGLLDEAVTHYQKAISLKPDFADGHNNLANAYRELGRLDESVAEYHKAIEIQPNFAALYTNLAAALHEQGKIAEATQQIDVALSYNPDKVGWQIRKTLYLPIIPSSQEEIESRRETLAQAVAALISQNLTVADPVTDVGHTGFYLAYHNQNNKSLMQDIAKLYIAACPKLTYEAKHCQSGHTRRKGFLRIGFLSALLRDHTIGKLTRGLIQQLSRDQFEVIVFRPPDKTDSLSAAIDRSADRVVSLQGRLDKDHKIIEDEELDILFYPDIGMRPYTYFLSFARLAPVQAVTWGHPDTTGIPNMDYFISSELLEVSDASNHYSEQLIRLQNMPTYYFRPDPPRKKYAPEDYGLPLDVRLYVCPQTLFKFHPQFDTVLGDLLRRDSEGRLVLIVDKVSGYWEKLLSQRFNRAFPDVVDQVIFIPRVSHEKFLGLLSLADAVLDLPSFSGGNSTLEAFSVGAPIITWPQDFMRGRVTAGFYKQMGLNELIAADAESYLTLSLRLAQDADFKRRMKSDIEANAHKLYETEEVVREMETFFTTAYEAWKTGNNYSALIKSSNASLQMVSVAEKI